MNTSIKITALAITLILTSCANKVEKKNIEPQVFETNEIAMSDSSDIVDEIVKEKERSVVFITGFDKGSKTYFSDARAFFKEIDTEIVETAYSLQEIILWLNINQNNKPISKIHIVANNKMNKILLETTVNGEGLSSKAIQSAVESGELPKLENVLAKDAKVILHSAGLGSQTELINEFKRVFTTDVTPSVIASKSVSVFSGQFSEHFLAKPFYGFYPTAKSPGRVDLAKEFSKNYPESDIEWLSAMENDSERFQGDIYSYKFNIPVKWEIAYEAGEEIPGFRTLDEMYTFMKDHDLISKDLEQLDIPIEKFRWFQTVKDDKLVIEGKVTVVCILEPVMSPAYPSEYMNPSIDNIRLYNRL
jgi:hypothetical protein